MARGHKLSKNVNPTVSSTYHNKSVKRDIHWPVGIDVGVDVGVGVGVGLF